MKPAYSELLQMSTAELADIVVAQGAKIDSLEAQHKDLKLRNSLLRERKDLPVERLTAYDELQKESDELKAHCNLLRQACKNHGYFGTTDKPLDYVLESQRLVEQTPQKSLEQHDTKLLIDFVDFAIDSHIVDKNLMEIAFMRWMKRESK